MLEDVIELGELMDGSHKPNEDWYIPRPLNEKDRENRDGRMRLLVRLQFRFSNLAMYDELRNDFMEYLHDDFDLLALICQEQFDMSAPFELEVIKRFQGKSGGEMTKEE
jgi:hypothetical protein